MSRITASVLLASIPASTLSARANASVLLPRISASILQVQMPQGPDFSPMDIGETITGAIDFSRWLAPSVTIASVVSVSVVNYFPIGGSTYVSLVGSPTIGTAPTIVGGSGVTNMAVLQQWQGIGPGTIRVIATILTSDGQTLSGWAHQVVSAPN